MRYSTLALLLLCLGGTFAKPSSLPEVIDNCFGGKCQQNNGGSEDFQGFEGWPSGGQPGLDANSGEGGFGQWPFGGSGGFGGFPNNAFGPELQQEPLGVSALGARYRTRQDVTQDVAASQELDSAAPEDRIGKVEKEPKFEEELKQEQDEEKDEEDEKDKEEEKDEQNDEPEKYQKENQEEGQAEKEEKLKLEESPKPSTTAIVINNCLGGKCQQNNGGFEGLEKSFNGWPSGGQSGFGDNNGEVGFGQWPFGGSGGFGGFPQQEPLGNSALGDLYRTRQAVTQDLAASLELKSSATEDRSRKVVESQDDQREIMVEEKINLEEELEQQEKQEEEDQEDKEEQEEDQNDELKGYQEKDQEEEHE